jgi:hypothetical protein
MQQYTLSALCAALWLLISLSACKHEPLAGPNGADPNDPPTVGAVCSPDTAYFQNQVLPLLISNCTQSGCHNAQDRQDGVALDSYPNLLSTVDKVGSTDWGKNKLLKAILETDPDKRMPRPPSAPLTAAQIDLLKKWVAQGALNNSCDEGAGKCDTTANRYSLFVKPLILAKCQGCHSGAAPQGNIRLDTYASVRAVALNGKLYGAVARTSNWMPKGGAKLDNCSSAKLKAWIDSGAPEN